MAGLGDEAGRLNLSAVARALGIYTCRLWHYVRGRNRWPAEEWLRVMILTGQVQEGRQRFEIYLPKTPGMCRAYDALKDKGYLRWGAALSPTDEFYTMEPKEDDDER